MTQLHHSAQTSSKVALVTGAARRLGAATVRQLHQAGFLIVLHYRSSAAAAHALADELNAIRPESVRLLTADLTCQTQVLQLATDTLAVYGRLDLLVNNASSFYPTPMGTVTEAQWLDLFASNAKAPFFLSQALLPALTKQNGCIINMVDIHADKPLAEHPVYCMAKAALVMMTRALARELAPTIRVNAVAPGAILWPEAGLPDQVLLPTLTEQDKTGILAQIPLGALGQPEDIARTVLFLACSPYITGQIVAVDGGRSLGGASKA